MHNVIILPQTIKFYQIELTRMLENEQYREAHQLLQFLLSCQQVDEQTSDEWKFLSQWLETVLNGADPDIAGEAEELSEIGMIRHHLNKKIEYDQGYVDRLLNTLGSDASFNNQVLALEQLTHIDHPLIDESLIQWLTSQELHPWIQFKGMQSLKQRGIQQSLEIPRNGKKIKIDLQEVPLQTDEFPEHIMDIMNKVQSITEVNDPELYRFVEHIWEQFVSFIYGTAMYRRLASQDEGLTDAWAAALHRTMLDMLSYNYDADTFQETYGLTEELIFMYEQAYVVLQHFVTQMTPALS